MIKKIVMMLIVFNVQAADNSDSMNPAAYAAAQAKIEQSLAQSWVQAVQQSLPQKKLKQTSRKLPRQLLPELRNKRLPKNK